VAVIGFFKVIWLCNSKIEVLCGRFIMRVIQSKS
jgi:hypothetical protein